MVYTQQGQGILFLRLHTEARPSPGSLQPRLGDREGAVHASSWASEHTAQRVEGGGAVALNPHNMRRDDERQAARDPTGAGPDPPGPWLPARTLHLLPHTLRWRPVRKNAHPPRILQESWSKAQGHRSPQEPQDQPGTSAAITRSGKGLQAQRNPQLCRVAGRTGAHRARLKHRMPCPSVPEDNTPQQEALRAFRALTSLALE
ncbi:uncharacterized protein LOC110348091 [Heterocephalus glaber]|uniref:Uncharacterized protein LOC110348091 n=1 Tax=Heterocephalus glaber TaxID=10181 RepID=A0AAX6SJT8_HETGA|nr:uncharacterized protein LOC110348091 [Heterocephalus glaber]